MQTNDSSQGSAMKKWLAMLMRGGACAKPAAARDAASEEPTAAVPPALLAEDEVSDVSIARLLDAALIEYKPGHEDVLHCRTLGGLVFGIAVRDRLKLLQLWASFSTADPQQRAEHEAAAAAINDTLAIGRAAIDRDGDLVVDAHLSYAGGLVPKQLLHTIALFERACVQAGSFLPGRAG